MENGDDRWGTGMGVGDGDGDFFEVFGDINAVTVVSRWLYDSLPSIF